MYEEPDDSDQPAPERAADPVSRAKEKADEFRMHAELAAVFEAKRKFDAVLDVKFDAEVARDVQRTIAKLEKQKIPETPVIKPESMDEAKRLLLLPATADAITTNDYHIARRPGECMILRWLAGDEVDTFYTRLQAHFDAALGAFKEEEKQQHAWRQEPETQKYLEALDTLEVKMADRYLRDPIKKHGVYVLSTQTADEIDILHLCDYVMGVESAAVVGRASAPPEDGATERDRAWFFKLFSLRGVVENMERMCFFTFLQKTDDESW